MKRNQVPLVIGGLVLLAILASFATANTPGLGWPMKAVDAFLLIFSPTYFVARAYMSSVRFYSPQIVDEDGSVQSSFDNNYEFIDDEMYGPMLAIYWGGYNSAARKFVTQADVTTTKDTRIDLVPVRMVEQMANGRFLVIRGKLNRLSTEEVRALAARQSMQNVFGGVPPKIKRFIEVRMAVASKSLHPDVLHEGEGVDVNALMSYFQSASGELREAVRDHITDNSRAMRFIQSFRPPRHKLDVIDVQKPKEQPEEKK